MRQAARAAKARQGATRRLSTFESILHGRLTFSRAALFSSVSVCALLVAAPSPAQQAHCPSGSYQTCEIPEGTATGGFENIYTTTGGDEDHPDGYDAGSYTLTNDAKISFNPEPDQFGILGIRMRGGGGYNGHDGGRGGDGGVVTITNNGDISGNINRFVGNAGDGAQMGLWDDPWVVYGLYGSSAGYEGADADNPGIGGGDGGHGGNGNEAHVTNNGMIDLNLVGPLTNTPGAAVGLLASSSSGGGGAIDGTDGEDPEGGSAGDAKAVTAENHGTIKVYETSSYSGDYWLTTLAAGIYAESISGNGDSDSGSGGNGGMVDVTNSGGITVTAPVAASGAAWGIYAASQAGYAGIENDSIGEDGGHGGSSKVVTITHGGAITVNAGDFDAPEATPISRMGDADDEVPAFTKQAAGILAFTLGAAGGSSRWGGIITNADGGRGGDAGTNEDSSALAKSTITLSDGASVTVTGDNIIGVGLFAEGGDGGIGASDEGNGGDGGDTGDLGFTLGAGTQISTDGENAIGLIGHTKGGPGGPLKGEGSIVDFRDEDAGIGGDSGGIILSAPGAGQTAATIRTAGDRAVGVVLQSLAGSGGAANSGYAVLDVGATYGGNGGNPNGIYMNGNVDVETSGNGAHGTLLQSIAGGGGALTSDGGLIAVAGAGGSGESGGTVQFFGKSGLLATHGDASSGIAAQSIGGGGGDVTTYGGSASVVTVGGQGGYGGPGGLVEVEFQSGTDVETDGHFSYGVLAQSIGGGGGNGGDVFNISARTPNVAVGGDGGVGGNGGEVRFTSKADSAGDRNLAHTRGDNAHGLLLQSIGGGGGAGGNARSVSVGIGALSAIAMAGGGASGGDGGTVTVNAQAFDIRTEGSHSKGVIAHSIGGGGGAGGSASSIDQSFGLGTAVSVGGQGGECDEGDDECDDSAEGGSGGNVVLVFDDATITTGVEGAPSDAVHNHGIVAQSIGGGGGDGGSADAKSFVSQLEIPGTDVAMAVSGAAGVGGTGGKGGAGGPVTIQLDNTFVTTYGDGGHGVVAHSIGGGGGNGGDGASIAAASLLRDKISELIPGDEEEKAEGVKINISVSVGVGGQGGEGGSGDTVTLDLGGGTQIESYGPSANAVLAQSIGGGGGNGGIASTTTKAFGEGSSLWTGIGVGGTGGWGGDGGHIVASLAQGALLKTHGEGSRGMVLQSIGGGGGTSQTTAVSFSSNLFDKQLQKYVKVKAPRMTVGVGMTGGNGGYGRSINLLDIDGDIVTFGADADGILAQSLGGGGGLGGSFGGGGTEESEDGGVVKKVLDFGLEYNELKEQLGRPWALNLNVGGTGGQGGPGGDFAVTATATDTFAVPSVAGQVITYGDFSDGVVLQSIGGGGGVGGAAVPNDSIGFLDLSMRIGGTGGSGGSGGSVGLRLEDTAQISTGGFGAHGVVLQSVGGGGGMGGSGSRLIGNLGLDVSEDDAFEELDPEELYDNVNEPLDPAFVRLGIGASGAGGDAADASQVEVTGVAENLIRTAGYNAFGLVAQSVGGGGGIGGIGTAPLTGDELKLENSQDDPHALAAAINALFRGANLDFIAGGDGGKGGDGGPVTVQGVFNIATTGPRGLGMIVQSVGGGGGAAGIEGSRLLRSGSDGVAGSAGPVSAMLNAGSLVSTAGIGAHGMVVQSVASGGGTTASTLAYGTALRRYDEDAPPTTPLGIGFELGLGAGAGGGTGLAGPATLGLSGSFTTTGDYAYGAIAQSVARGGGVVSLTPAEIDRASTTTVSSGEIRLGAEYTLEPSGAGADDVVVDVDADTRLQTTGVGSRGILAQSIGGGGGIASGFEVLKRPSAGEGNAVSMSLSLGDGLGGAGRASSLSFLGSVLTLGADADALLLQAISGAGGVMGSAGGASATIDENGNIVAPAAVDRTADATAYDMQIELGTIGGGLGDLTAMLGGTVATWGDFAEAAIIQQVEGGGVAGLSVDPTSDATANLSIRVGADGMSGMDFDEASVQASLNGATYGTAGYGANGVVIQEIAGGGGIAASGARSARAVLETLSDGTQRHGLTVGGDNGFGSMPGRINATIGDGSLITTAGDGAFGVVVQNIVGGGGIGAVGTSLRDKDGSAGTYQIDVSVGGRNDTPQDNCGRGLDIADCDFVSANSVDIDLSEASVVTTGDLATALLAQSIGGGGGLAISPATGVNSLRIGAHDQSGNGGDIRFNPDRLPDATSLVQTQGDFSRGVVLQSIGGGGGVFSGTPLGGVEINAPILLGGYASGSRGYDASGNGGLIVANFLTQASTVGHHADGLVLQSIGGGGGIADLAASTGPSGQIWLGQSFGKEEDTDGGSLSLTYAGLIATVGDFADGMVLQSIGGGGGIVSVAGTQAGGAILLGRYGEDDGGSGGNIDISFDDSRGNNIATTGYGAYGVLLQSIGGGGGQVGIDTDRFVGRVGMGATDQPDDDENNHGRAVTARGEINLTTTGDDAHGIVAQSIGGGGGVTQIGNNTAVDADSSHSIDVVLGSTAHEGIGSGDQVNLTLNTYLNTFGDRAIGIIAQSIGGGGGIAGAGSKDNINSLTLGAGGSERSNDDGDPVAVGLQSGSWITTNGTASHGIVAQSIGGGGGIGGEISGHVLKDEPDARYDADAHDDDDDNGDAVSVNVDGNIYTMGDYAYGIIAQSIGGGGGLGGDAAHAYAGSTGIDGTADTVTVVQSGTVSTTGANAIGIFAQSQGTSYSNNNPEQDNGVVSVTVNGDVIGGSDEDGWGVWVSSGINNTITVNAGGSVSAGSGNAVKYTAGTSNPADGSILTLNNHGFVSGNISDGVERFDSASAVASRSSMTTLVSSVVADRPGVRVFNHKGGILTGAAYYNADIKNAGSLIVGDSLSTDTLNIAGDFAQTATGEMVAAAHFANGKRDLVEVDQTATLGGVLMLEPLAVLYNAELTMLTAEGGISGRFSEIHSKLFTFEQRLTQKEIAIRVAGAHFDRPDFGLNKQQANVAGYLGDLFLARSIGQAEAFGGLEFAARAGEGDYRSALSRLSPGASLAGEAASFELAQGRFQTLLDCSWQWGTYSNEEGCLQLIGSGQQVDMSGGSNAFGYDGDIYSVGVAGQAMLTPDWRVGGMIGYETSDFTGHDGYGSAEGGTVFAGLSATRSIGHLSLSAAGVVSHGNFDTTRAPGLTAGNSLGRADHDVTSVAGRFRAAYRYDLGMSYVKPMVDLDMIWTGADGYTESGAEVLGLKVDDSDEMAFVATPSLEAGRSFGLGDSLQLRLYGRAGISFSTLDNYQVKARFAAADPAVGSFNSDVAIPDVVGRISAGAELIGMDNLGLDLRYDGAFGSGLTSHAGSLRLNYKF